MTTQNLPLRRLRSLLVGSLGLVSLVVLPFTAHAALVTSWTQTAGTNGTDLNTASPVFGTGATNSGNGAQVYAATPSTYTLGTVGDSLAFTGAVTFDLNSNGGSDQFRFGLFDTNASSTTTGWLGYFATNSGSGANPNGRLWERKDGNTAAYFNNAAASADQLQAFSGSPAGIFASGSYNFSLVATRTETGLSVFWSIIGTSVTYSISGTYADATPQTYTFDRVGFMSGGGLNADQMSFSNVDLTYTSAIPEPASWGTLAACVVLGTACLRRRARM